MTHECPLCGTDFEESKCPSSCPLSHGCAMTRCPRCGYEFVENGTVAAKVRNWWTSFVNLVGEAANRRDSLSSSRDAGARQENTGRTE